MQSSIYDMDLENEIHFIPALFYNVNLDPTRRYGSETSASLRVSDTRARCAAAWPTSVPCFAKGSLPAKMFRWFRTTPQAAA